MDDGLSGDVLTMLARVREQGEGLADDDRAELGGWLMGMTRELLGPDLWLVTVEGLFLGHAQDILAMHLARDQASDSAP